MLLQHRLSQHYPSLSENSSESDSINRKEHRPRLLPDFIHKSESAARAKSFDGLAGVAALLNKTSFKENKEHNKSKISFNDSIVPRRQKLRISQQTSSGGGNKFGGLSVSKAQILRRHTLHDKSNQRQSLQNVHVHSWHKAVSILKISNAYCQALSIYLSISFALSTTFSLNLSLSLRDRADTIITFHPPPQPQTF